ncbi:MAG TPA: stalk domain-containing protein [Caldisericia bacterium]|nr:stalk domain-containing protein [Caldisericia bacterium]
MILICVSAFAIMFQTFINTNFMPIAKAENDTELDFGTILKGDSAKRTIGFVADITNTNTIEGYLISDNFWIVLDPEKFTLKPGESINIKVTVNTSNLLPQEYKGQFHVYTTGIPSTLSYNVKVKVVERKPILNVSEKEIDFGLVAKDKTYAKRIELYNTGYSQLTGSLKSNKNWLLVSEKNFSIDQAKFESIVVTINTEGLKEQYYSGEIKIESNGGNETVTVRMKVKEAQPYLVVSPTIIDLGDVKSDEVIEKELTIKNDGDGILEGEIKTSIPWIELSILEFRLFPNISKDIQVTINTEGLKEQYYSGEIKIESNGGNETVTVRMKVKEAQPYLVVSPTIIDLGDVKSDEVIEKELTIKNDGDGILEGEIKTSIPWIELSEKDFRIFSGEKLSIKCKFNPIIIDIGKYKEKIILISNIGNFEVPVLINRMPFPPKLMISSDNLDFGNVEIGSMSSLSLNLWNNGEEPLKIQVNNPISWVTLSQSEFILYRNQNITLFLNINTGTEVEEKAYEDFIDIISNGGNKRIKIKVFFTEKKIVIDLQIGNKFAKINGILYELDSPPQLIKNRTFVPIRFVSEAMQAKVNWIGYPTNEVQIFFEDIIIHLWVGNNIARIEYFPQLNKNPETVTLDAPPTIINNRVLVPIRFISETFGAKVDWDKETQSINIILKVKKGS